MIKLFFKITVKGENHKNVRDHFFDFDNKNLQLQVTQTGHHLQQAMTKIFMFHTWNSLF